MRQAIKACLLSTKNKTIQTFFAEWVASVCRVRNFVIRSMLYLNFRGNYHWTVSQPHSCAGAVGQQP